MARGTPLVFRFLTARLTSPLDIRPASIALGVPTSTDFLELCFASLASTKIV
jgi:hypothetical protein